MPEPLPPGQTRIDGFPRFGADLDRPPPEAPADPVLEVAGAVTAPVSLPLGALAERPQREVMADLHCVAGWTATGLRWEGVPFAELYAEVVAPVIAPGAEPTHVALVGRDGYRAVTLLEELLASDVLLALRLDGELLSPDHGAPLRLVSPHQYGYVNVKYLTRVELHEEDPGGPFHTARRTHLALRLVTPHLRARVAHEERHRHLPGRLVRPLYQRVGRSALPALAAARRR